MFVTVGEQTMYRSRAEDVTRLRALVAQAARSILDAGRLPSGDDITPWQLANISFLADNGEVGKMVMDSGATESVLSRAFVERAKLKLRPFAAGERAVSILLPSGETVPALGEVDFRVQVQCMMLTPDGHQVHWDRRVTMKKRDRGRPQGS